jgi:hypothetical protein
VRESKQGFLAILLFSYIYINIQFEILDKKMPTAAKNTVDLCIVSVIRSFMMINSF